MGKVHDMPQVDDSLDKYEQMSKADLEAELDRMDDEEDELIAQGLGSSGLMTDLIQRRMVVERRLQGLVDSDFEGDIEGQADRFEGRVDFEEEEGVLWNEEYSDELAEFAEIFSQIEPLQDAIQKLQRVVQRNQSVQSRVDTRHEFDRRRSGLAGYDDVRGASLQSEDQPDKMSQKISLMQSKLKDVQARVTELSVYKEPERKDWMEDDDYEYALDIQKMRISVLRNQEELDSPEIDSFTQQRLARQIDVLKKEIAEGDREMSRREADFVNKDGVVNG